MYNVQSFSLRSGALQVTLPKEGDKFGGLQVFVGRSIIWNGC
jgi:hypothetical protein